MNREEVYYKPCSTCHNADCVWMGTQDTHKKCEDYQSLEQEPCDAINREAVLDTLENMDKVLTEDDRTVETYKELLIACINDLTPVYQEPKEN